MLDQQDTAARPAPAGESTAAQVRISVLMPMLNAVRFVDEAIASVVAQSDPRWELIVVDDGSADGSRAIVERWARAEPARIRVLQHTDGGTHGSSASRNLALSYARGAYVALLDADDVWQPDHLARLISLLQRFPDAGFAYGPTEDWHGWTGHPADLARDRVPELRVPHGRLLPPPGPLAEFIRREAPSPCTCSVLMRRELVQAVGGFEAEFPGMYDDQVLYAKLLLRTPCVVSSACTSRYRRHADSCYSTAKRTGRADAERVRFLAWLERYAAGHARAEALEATVARELRLARHPRLATLIRALRRRA